MLPGDRILLTEKQLEGIDSHIEVQHKLRDERVLRMLQRIDSAPNRVKALEKEMKDPAFLEFCDDVLEAVGCRSQENEDLSIEERLLALLQQ